MRGMWPWEGDGTESVRLTGGMPAHLPIYMVLGMCVGHGSPCLCLVVITFFGFVGGGPFGLLILSVAVVPDLMMDTNMLGAPSDAMGWIP